MDRVCALIGDVVASRRAPERRALQQRVEQALADANVVTEPLQPLEATVGDEFQGLYATAAEATTAALLVRLAVLPDVDVRCGLGGGAVEVIDGSRRPMLQDGTAWWAAREALVELARPRRADLRTWYVGPGEDDVTAFLLLRDGLVDRLNDRGRRLLAGALRGLTQAELARVEGVGPSAVSQQFARGVGAVREAQQRFVAASASTGQTAQTGRETG